MHYYQFNIGDYRRQTYHLTLLEHGIYRSLIDTYYLSESSLCKDDAEIMRTHCIRSEDEKNAFKNIMKDFFILTKKGYEHKTCDHVISKFKEKSEKARLAANKRWDAFAMRTQCERNANHKPITNNHKPIKEKNKKKVSQRLDYSCWPEMPNEQTLKDWITMRKRFKADVTQTVINQFSIQLKKAQKIGHSVNYSIAECVLRNWRGFKADWLDQNLDNGQNVMDKEVKKWVEQDD